MDNLYDLFEHELKDLYDAEKKLVKALEMQSNEVVDTEVSEAYEAHREQTVEHVARLERIFELLEVEPKRETCHGIDGLLREREAFLKEDPSIDLLQLFNLGAAVKVELYEIAAYESVLRLAEQLEVEEEVLELLVETLEEEEETLDILEGFLDEKPQPASTGKATARTSR